MNKFKSFLNTTQNIQLIESMSVSQIKDARQELVKKMKSVKGLVTKPFRKDWNYAIELVKPQNFLIDLKEELLVESEEKVIADIIKLTGSIMDNMVLLPKMSDENEGLLYEDYHQFSEAMGIILCTPFGADAVVTYDEIFGAGPDEVNEGWGIHMGKLPRMYKTSNSDIRVDDTGKKWYAHYSYPNKRTTSSRATAYQPNKGTVRTTKSRVIMGRRKFNGWKPRPQWVHKLAKVVVPGIILASAGVPAFGAAVLLGIQATGVIAAIMAVFKINNFVMDMGDKIADRLMPSVVNMLKKYDAQIESDSLDIDNRIEKARAQGITSIEDIMLESSHIYENSDYASAGYIVSDIIEDRKKIQKSAMKAFKKRK